MAVGELTDSSELPVAGIRLSAVASNIRYENRLDLVLIELCESSSVAGVYTQNAFCAAPVLLAKDNVERSAPRYFLINTGNANAGTGEQGYLDAQACCQALADLTQIKKELVAPFSTGVIGEALPVDKIVLGLPGALKSLDSLSWLDAAKGIMTTDTRPKFFSRKIRLDGKSVTISGIAKGAGMIKPNMATMLAFVFTDARIPQDHLQKLLKKCTDRTFNRLTVDGDTSTNDCCMLVATGQGELNLSEDSSSASEFENALQEIFFDLATGLIRDAEGASKFITLQVKNGLTEEESLKVAYCVAESPLVKTAMFASDPNWGRILAAIGRAGLDSLNINGVSIFLGEVCIVLNGAVCDTYTELAGQTEMDKEEIRVTIDLQRGSAQETVWTSDLSTEYVRINADYRS